MLNHSRKEVITIKTRAIKTTLDEYCFDSKMEARYYKHLKALKKEGIVERFEMQPKFLLQEGFSKKGKRFSPITYKADFLVIYTNGIVEVVDVKGRKDAVFNLKYKLFEFKYPEYSLKLVTDALKTNEFIDYSLYLKLKRQRKRRKR